MTLVLGFGLGSLVQRTGSLWGVVLAHAMADPFHWAGYLAARQATSSGYSIADAVTALLLRERDRRSVAIAASLEQGMPAFERWLGCPDGDVRWVVRENLRKARLGRMDAAWVAAATAQLERSPAEDEGGTVQRNR